MIDGEGRVIFGGGIRVGGFGVFVAHCFLTTDSITGMYDIGVGVMMSWDN